LEAARAAAAKRGVPLAVKFYSPWCPVSTKVNATTFQNPEVAKACVDRVELVSLKVEEHPLVAQEMGVAAVPTVVVLAPDGSRKLASVTADDLRDPQAFRARLTELAPQP
jgi:thioredoxin-like negative regulator of GroEL